MNPNRPARLNRTLLALLGLLLLLAGALVLLVGSRVATSASAGLSVAADASLLPPNPDPPAWLTWAGTAVAVVVGLAALRWLVAQAVRVPPGTNWQLADNPHTGATTLSTTTAAAPLAAEISTYPGVCAATARLAGVHQHPELHIRITIDDRASPSDLRHRIDEAAVPRLVGALDLPALDADLLLRPTGR
jgi:hypothetical protein